MDAMDSFEGYPEDPENGKLLSTDFDEWPAGTVRKKFYVSGLFLFYLVK